MAAVLNTEVVNGLLSRLPHDFPWLLEGGRLYIHNYCMLLKHFFNDNGPMTRVKIKMSVRAYCSCETFDSKQHHYESSSYIMPWTHNLFSRSKPQKSATFWLVHLG